MKTTPFFSRLLTQFLPRTNCGFQQLLGNAAPTLMALTLGLWMTAEVIRATMIPGPFTFAQLPQVLALSGLDLLLSFFIMLLVPPMAFGPTNANLGRLLSQYGTDLFNESLRVAAQIAFWSLVFIVPGIIMYLRLAFVPFIVLADPTYQAGQRDALKYSKSLIKGMTIPWGLLNLIFLVGQFGISQIESFAENWPFAFALCWRLAITVLNVIFILYTTVLAFVIYEFRVQHLSNAEQN